MKISEILKQDKVTLSLEVFPPKTSEKYQAVAAAAKKVAELHPDFMSVTYGAGGGTGLYTADIAQEIQEKQGVPMLAHLTCVSSSREHVRKMVGIYKEKGIENILTLRGDIPRDGVLSQDYRHAVDLIQDVRELGDFCLGGACYPEGHVETPHKADDIRYLKEKVDAGLDFLTTQMFFDNNVYFHYLARLRTAGVTIPVIAGVMPVTNGRQIRRICQLSGTYLPPRFRAIVDRFGDSPAAMLDAGVAYATEQIVDLFANGVNAVHVYTMNHPEIGERIMSNLGSIAG